MELDRYLASCDLHIRRYMREQVIDKECYPVAFLNEANLPEDSERISEFSFALYSYVSSQLVESMNAANAPIRKFYGRKGFCLFIFISDLFEQERKRYHSNRQKAIDYGAAVPPNMHKLMSVLREEAIQHTVTAISDIEFEVSKHSNRRQVASIRLNQESQQLTCSIHSLCFTINGYPCACIIAVTRFLQLDPGDYLESIWKTSSWRNQYSSDFPHVSIPALHTAYEIRKEKFDKIRRVPEMPRRKGRPRQLVRFDSTVGDWSGNRRHRRRLCGYCKFEGHTKRSCPRRQQVV
uniref:SWIM-type domain-containing protein n=1 Tax=Aplanochytrium stocchinoi TaxID=215587 RepID=A0A7S3LKR6_9STRA